MAIEINHNVDVAVITIQRPDVYNCLDFSALHQLRRLIDELAGRQEIRVVIITGAGEKAFCSGADLKERKAMTEAEVERYILLIRDTFTALENMPKPTIAAINGLALGGGTELALACDLRIIAKRARMGLTETSLGIIPGAGGTQRLPRIVGLAKAKELIFTARTIEADEALAIGLVNEIAEDRCVLTAAWELAAQITANAPLAIAQAKHAIDRGAEVDLVTGLAIESEAYRSLIPTRDRLEGLRAFAEKRKPLYKGV
ncbi:enoyl-CoA hydratase [Ammoniphilus oxalaticus]|uniref:Enoyl-CoA hydratase n=1 Tax=Ammoniphilus oxalaticus TaxID=66863 RepID=A0A419SJ66_9BACL|nr:enoyl-CoA hydratase-related protein [Ammoniphilus oxalaticus]RKD24084.1 enoyl-CoA hydratase [Ammoniphilus oxalaticus]